MKVNSSFLLASVAGFAPVLGTPQASETVDCLLAQRNILKKDGSSDPDFFPNSGFACFDEKGVGWELEGVPAALLKARDVVSGKSILSISSAQKVPGDGNGPNRLKVNQGSLMGVRNDGRRPGRMLRQSKREMAQTEGTSTVLIVRVSDKNNMQPQLTAAQLYQDFFSDAVNLKSQYSDCSGGKLNLQPAPAVYDGMYAEGGVIDVRTKRAANGVFVTDVEAWAATALQAIIGDELQYNHVVFVMPGGVDFGNAEAYGYINNHRSVIWDTSAANLYTQMHTIGHNLGLFHSGRNGLEYGDSTDIMGQLLRREDYPKSCFNGAKSWQLGWYSAGHTTVNPSEGSWDGRIVGADDFARGNYDSATHKSVIKVDNPANPDGDLYIMYNRKKGMNAETQIFGDTVTIVSQGEGIGQQSWLLGTVTEETAAYRDETWPGGPLVIEVCSRSFGAVDEAHVLVHLDGVNSASCDSLSSPTTGTVGPATADPTTSDPTTTAPTTPLAGLGESCVVSSDCYSGSCSTDNNANNRVCIEGGIGDGTSLQCLPQGSKCNQGTCCNGCAKNTCL